MSCLFISLMHTTGRSGSYGRWYTSRTSSMDATNSTPAFGIHHSFPSHGLSSFFSLRHIQYCPLYNPQLPDGSVHLRLPASSRRNGLRVHPSRRSHRSVPRHPWLLCDAYSAAVCVRGLIPFLPLQNVLLHPQSFHC